MNDLISIIVPIYKVETYIRESVESLLNQTYKNIEIILVDDGSPDNCGKICDEYQRTDSRIKVVHKENGGVSSARNAGLDVATGDYIGFIDPDDRVESDMYEYLLSGMKEYNADITTCEWYLEYPDKLEARRREQDVIYNGKDAMKALLQLKFGNYAWNKLYKKELWNDVRYPVGKNYEDVRTTYRIIGKVNTLAALKDPKYYYLQNENGIVRNKSILNKISCVESRMERYENIINEYPNQKAFLLREIFNYTVNLRDSIVSATTAEFNKCKVELQPVILFLNNHSDDIIKYVPMGHIWKKEFGLFKEGEKRIYWVISKFFSKLRGLKDKIKEGGIYKKYIKLKKEMPKVKKNIKESKMIDYYYKCVDQLPIEEDTAFVESRGGQDFASNIFYTVKALSNAGLKIYVSVYWGDRHKARNMINKYNLTNVSIVYKNTKDYFKVIATAKYLFNDMVYNDKIIKKPGQVWTNLWHGTPLKNLEFDVANNRHELGGATREFTKTDYIVAPSKYMLEKLVSSSKTTNVLKNTYALYTGYPRNEVFFDIEERKRVRAEQDLLDKEVFIYMPTWRGTFNNHDVVGGKYSISNILNFFENNLKENQIMYVKLHNFDNAKINYNNYNKVKAFPSNYELYSFINIGDCLITDYSSIFFDFANTRKKIILFTYDREEYLMDRGVYIPIEELPFAQANNYEELLIELNIDKHYNDDSFIEEYCTYDSANSAQDLINHILGKNISEKQEKIVGNGKKNILIYDSCIKYRDRVYEDTQNYLNSLETDEYNYIYCFRQNICKKIPPHLQYLRNDIEIYAVTPTPNLTFTEKLYFSIFHKITKKCVLREIKRSFYNLSFEDVIILDENNFDPFIDVIKHLKLNIKKYDK